VTSPSRDLVFLCRLRAILFWVSPLCDFALGYRLRAIWLLGIAFMQFTIKNVCFLIGVKSITLVFGY
jgi:hypothetical protein